MIASLMTWYNYHKNCVSAFYSSQVSVFENQTVVDRSIGGDMLVDFDWHAGSGYICVMLATVLKIVDVICNLAVPTPSICRDKEEQQIYEIVALNRDVDVGASSFYTSRESVQKLQESVMMAKEEASRFRLSMMDDSGLGCIVECGKEEEEYCLDAINESSENVTASLQSATTPAPPETTTTTPLDVPLVPTPSQRRLHNSVYF